MEKKIPQKLRISILNRDNHKCLWCGRSAVDGVTLDVDHVIAEYWDGKTEEDNLGTLCSHCNRAKGANYYGPYLLSTIYKLNKNVVEWFKDEFVGKNVGRTDGDSYKWQIIFFRNKNVAFLPQIIEHEYFIGGLFLETQENDDTNIQIEEIKNKALLQFKDKIGDYLFENKGFLEELDDKLVFRERK